MNRIVECVPNFSEGRRPEVIDAIVEAMTSTPDVHLLGREMDADHNRAVVTVVGTPEAIRMAAFRAVETAARHIDLTEHRGEHPRMGATDVLPFIPIRGVTLAECVEIARDVGRQIAEELSIPVFLYEAAATRPERAQLENVRRGQFEGLRDEIGVNPNRAPDFGAARVHPTAGAIAVGARKPLIAYNINLNTSDVAVARQIAKSVRFSSGGFRYVKALGLFLENRNQAQVSMNLTDYEQTSIELVFETVRREAERFGVSVGGSEIIGFIPQKALNHAAEFFLQVENFKPSTILENRIAEVIAAPAYPPGGESIRGFIERVASSEPVPAGGSVSALSGALGVALGEMCMRITMNKKGHEANRERFADALERLTPFRAALYDLIDADANAYTEVIAAYRMPKGSAERRPAIQKAFVRATEIPSKSANCASEALRIMEEIRPIVDANVASDLHVGLQMLRAAMRGAISNMRVNLESVEDTDVRLKFADMITGWEQMLQR